jgi:hypothetical protein
MLATVEELLGTVFSFGRDPRLNKDDHRSAEEVEIRDGGCPVGT